MLNVFTKRWEPKDVSDGVLHVKFDNVKFEHNQQAALALNFIMYLLKIDRRQEFI